MKAKLIMKSKSRKSDRVKNRVKTTKPALGEGFMQLLADRTGLHPETENQVKLNLLWAIRPAVTRPILSFFKKLTCLDMSLQR